MQAQVDPLKETLALYNGRNGNAAYVAINGTVYDVTDVPQWRNGAPTQQNG